MSLKTREILVVDLDGTHLRSDMLFESFWSAFGHDWRSPFLSVAALTDGLASLKRHLSTWLNLKVAVPAQVTAAVRSAAG